MIDNIPVSQKDMQDKKQAAKTDIEIKLSQHIQNLFSKGIESMMDEDQLEERHNTELE